MWLLNITARHVAAKTGTVEQKCPQRRKSARKALQNLEKCGRLVAVKDQLTFAFESHFKKKLTDEFIDMKTRRREDGPVAVFSREDCMKKPVATKSTRQLRHFFAEENEDKVRKMHHIVDNKEDALRLGNTSCSIDRH